MNLPAPQHRRELGVAILRFLLSERVLSRIARISASYGLAWTAVQFNDRFTLLTVPPGWTGPTIFTLVGLCAWLASEWALTVHNRPAPQQVIDLRPPEQAFADSVISYARTLAASKPPRDQSLLQLRHWTSRLLHLTGNQRQRQELGQLALASAYALHDQSAQAAILIDDLGWSAFEAGDEDTAVSNIEEGITILKRSIQSAPTPDHRDLELQCKALRHIANIKARGCTLGVARGLLTEPRLLAAQLPLAAKGVHLAQLDHSEASIILSHLDHQLGVAGYVDPSGTSAPLLEEAVTLAVAAEQHFERLGDTERHAKALHLKVRLLAHDPRKQRYNAAVAVLSRLQAQVARNLVVERAAFGLQAKT